jgi:hypothetical protein
VAIVQHTSGVLKVANNIFEAGSEYQATRPCPTKDCLLTVNKFRTLPTSFTLHQRSMLAVATAHASVLLFFKCYLVLTIPSLLVITPSCDGKRYKALPSRRMAPVRFHLSKHILSLLIS